MNSRTIKEKINDCDLKVYSKTQRSLLSLMTAFDAACRANGIKYSLACGTALGAVRERGFIPWDNDVDIMMSIQDYKLMDMKFRKYSSSFCWVTSASEKKSPVVLARVYENNVCFDSLENFPYIDIHIYVGATNNDKELIQAINRVDFFSKIYWIKQRRYHNVFKRKNNLIGSLCKIPILPIPREYCKNQIKMYITKWDYKTAKRIFPLQGYYKMKEVIPKAWMDSYEDTFFSGKSFMIIKNYDAYLTQLYGDYMVPQRYK